MNISDAAQTCQLTTKALRHYESVGLVVPERRPNGYREYGAQHLKDLSFLAHSRAMGFSLEECRQLLELYRNPGRASADVKKLAQQKLSQLDAQLEQLHMLRDSLTQWVDHCPGDASPTCPIIQRLSETDAARTL